MTPLARITARATRQGHPGAEGTPVQPLSLEEFFDGSTEGWGAGQTYEAVIVPEGTQPVSCWWG